MEISANFAFLKQEFPHAAESASYAERHVYGDPRASCFHARHALERLLKRVYKVEKALKPPKVTNLDGYISDPAFRELVPKVVWQKAEYIRQAGNVAVHGNKTPAPEKALDVNVENVCHLGPSSDPYLGQRPVRKLIQPQQEYPLLQLLVLPPSPKTP